MSKIHVVSAWSDNNDDGIAVDEALHRADPDNILLGADYADAYHRDDYLVVADDDQIHAAMRHQDHPYHVSHLER